MSRHTLNDGVTIDPRLNDSYHAWWKRLAPDGRTVGAYHRGEITWSVFESAYRERLITRSNDLLALAELSVDADVILLCIEENPEYCHRRLLAEELKRAFPTSLHIEIF